MVDGKLELAEWPETRTCTLAHSVSYSTSMQFPQIVRSLSFVLCVTICLYLTGTLSFVMAHKRHF